MKTPRSARRSWLGSARAPKEGGAAAVEFALVSLILIPLLLGIVSFGLFFWGYQSANHAAREGARLAAVGVTNCADWQDTVARRAGGIIGLAGTGASYSVDGTQSPGDEVTVTIRFSIPGSPSWMLRAATAILPGDTLLVIPDGTDGVALETQAFARNEADGNSGC